MAEAAGGAGGEEGEGAVFVVEATGGHHDKAGTRGTEGVPQRERPAPCV